MRSVQPVLTIAFFVLFFFLIPDTLPPPVPPHHHHHSSGDTLTGHVWEGGKMDGVCEGSDARVAHLDCLQVFVALVRFEFP